MADQGSLAGRTILMSGGSRGIGLAIAIRAAADGANVALIAKTDQPDPRLPGTIHTAAEEIEKAGGAAGVGTRKGVGKGAAGVGTRKGVGKSRVLPIVGDVRNDAQVEAAVASTVERFGGIDIVVNNASAINLSNIGELPVKRYDLMLDINTRGTFLLTSLALPHLLNSGNAHVLTLSPPLDPDRRWLAAHAPYTLSKYGMTMLTLGVAEQYRGQGIAANCLWPRTTIATAAIQNIVGGEAAMAVSRRPEIMADAAHQVLIQPTEYTGQTLIDDEVLRAAGVTDFDVYRYPGATEDQLQADIFLGD